MSQIYEYVKDYSHKIDNRIRFLQSLLADAPEGYLKISHKTDGHVAFFNRAPLKDNRRLVYLNVNQKETIHRLARKRYAQSVLPKLLRNKAACDSFLKKHSGAEERECAEMMDGALIRLIPDIIRTRKDYCKEWETKKYPSVNSFHQEEKIHETLKGDLVRSKSEAMIADALYTNNIPYLYEFPLQLPGRAFPVYPDFTILHPATLKTVYWEHNGMLDSSAYADSCVQRLSDYHEAGIFEGTNLILTFETTKVPLSRKNISRIIGTFLKTEEN